MRVVNERLSKNAYASDKCDVNEPSVERSHWRSQWSAMLATVMLMGCAPKQEWTQADVYQGPLELKEKTKAPVPQAVSLWVTGPSHKVLRTEPQPATSSAWAPANKTVKLRAARNEFVSFQVVYAGSGTDITFELDALEGPGGKKLEWVQAYREHYVPTPVRSQYSLQHLPWDTVELDLRCGELGSPREFPVQLVPLEASKHGAPFDVTSQGNEVVWVDVFVPEGSPPGAYNGRIRTAGQELRVELDVWNFTLPSVSHFPSWAYAGPEEIAWSLGRKHTQIQEMSEAFDAYFQLAHDHRLVLMEGFENDEAYVRSAARRYFDYYTGAAFKGPFGAGFGFELLPTESTFGPLIQKQGWLNRAFVILEDEPGSRQQYVDVVRRGKAIREGPDAVGIRRMVTEQYTPTEPDWPHLDPETDIFCSGAIHPDNVATIERRQNAVWTYNRGHAGAPYVDAPGVAMRTHPWAGFVTGSRAWYFWGATYVVDLQNRWRKQRDDVRKDPKKFVTDLWNDPLTFDESKKLRSDGTPYPEEWALRLNGDGVLIYPGTPAGIDGPLPGFRLKNLRRGAQDFEYLYLLEKMGKRAEALAIAQKLLGNLRVSAESSDGQSGTAVFAYELDGAKWDEARIELGKLLHALGEDALRASIQPYNQYPNPVGHPSAYDGARY
jgi:hypothetical protein